MDPYAVLGVDPLATEREVVRAFRLLALKHHPDRNGGSGDAAARFREIQAAYEVVRERARKRPAGDGRHSRVIEPEEVERVRTRLEKLNEAVRAAIRAPTHDTLAAVIDDARWTRLDVDTALALKGHVADLRDAYWTQRRFTTIAEAIATFEAFTSTATKNLALIEMRNLRARLDGLLRVARGYDESLRA